LNNDVLENFRYWYGARRLDGGEDRFERICITEFEKLERDDQVALEYYCSRGEYSKGPDNMLRAMFRTIKLRFNRGDQE